MLRRIHFCCVLLVAGCGASVADPDGGPADDGAADDGAAPDAACAPTTSTTCEAAGAECGALDDGCGGTIACGECGTTQVCGLDAPNRCAGECASDAHCPSGLYCDPIDATCRGGCRGPATAITVDLSRVEVALEVLLDGAAPPASADDRTRSPSLHFVNLDSPDLGAEVFLYDGGVTRDDIVLSLSPGEHEVRYTSGWLEPGGWPRNIDAVIATVVIQRTTERITVDVPRAQVDLSVRLDGAPLPARTDDGSWMPTLRFWDAAFGRFDVPLYAHDAAGTYVPLGEQRLWVVPGTYDVRSEIRPSDWPAVTEDGVDLSVDRALEVDIRGVRVDVEATLGGAPLPPGGEGSLVIRRPPRGPYPREPQTWVRLAADATAEERSARLKPGRYELWYVPEARPADGWPRFAALLDEIDVIADATISVDVPVSEVDLSVVLEGATGTDRSCLPTVHVGATDFWSLGALPIDTAARPFAGAVWMVPGTYPVQIDPQRHCAAGEWPAVYAERSLVVEPGQTTATMTIPRRRLRIATTLDGATPPLLIGDGPPPSLSLRRGIHRSAPLPPYRANAGVLEPADVTVWVVPDAYDVLYDHPASFASEWPLAPAVLRAGVDVTEDVDLALDVRRTPVAIELTMNGGPIPWPEDPPWSLDWSPWFRIGPDSEPNLFRVLGIWRDSSGAPPPIDRFEGYLVPGTYRLGTGLYFGESLRAEGEIPTTGADLGCWIVPE